MCGLAGAVALSGRPIGALEQKLAAMSALIAHRGPDGDGAWKSDDLSAGLAHRRLAIIDLTDAGRQPMLGPNGTVIAYNGEIYNYLELRTELAGGWRFRSVSDTEVILAAYDRWGDDCVQHLRGMFAFAIWDGRRRRLYCARDRFGIKPFHYAELAETLYFASEAKALLPVLPSIETDGPALSQYLVLQHTIDGATLFKGVKQLLPAHVLVADHTGVRTSRYWNVDFEVDPSNTPARASSRLRELLNDSIALHLRSDVAVGGYMSGGLDSSLISILAALHGRQNRPLFHGKFVDYPGYDESVFADIASEAASGELHQVKITADDFRNHIHKVIYNLDYPIAGPGSFPQYMVSKLASRYVKVVLGGQGGDEIFGGYARYLVAYLEQCLRAAIDGTYKDGNFTVTFESIVPNLGLLREYTPMLQEFWRDGLFGNLDVRYFRLIDRSSYMRDEVDPSCLNKDAVYQQFEAVFNGGGNVGEHSYFDKMMHFDFKCLLPALLHVEDRMSMAHGLESRVPLLDHPLVEFAATVPADVKLQGGRMKHLLKTAFADVLPQQILERRDKMGFPVPLTEWFSGELREFVGDCFASRSARTRPFLRSKKVVEGLAAETPFSRKTWGLLNLELWHQMFHDRAAEWRELAQPKGGTSRDPQGIQP